MAKIDAVLPDIESASTNIKTYTEEFNEHAENTYQAAQTLSQSWEGDAAQQFIANMEQLHKWMGEMVTTLDAYSKTLSQIAASIREADLRSAGFFSRG